MQPYLIDTFRLNSPRALASFYEWLKDAWAYELGFLQEHAGSDPSLYHPVCCPLCSHHTHRHNFPRAAYSLLDASRKERVIDQDDPLVYSSARLQRTENKNNLTITQLHKHLAIKTKLCLLHNIYEVLLRAMYHDEHYRFFPTIRNPCDGLTPIMTPIHLADKQVDHVPIVHHGLDNVLPPPTI